MKRITYGYIRVSPKDQNEDRQFIAMRQFGVEHVFIDRQSLKDYNHPQYQALLNCLQEGDTLVIQSIDLLGKNYGEILEQWRTITKEKKTDVVVLGMPLLDTRKSLDLADKSIADIVLQLLLYITETDREFRHRRQQEVVASAIERGVRLGRKPKHRPEQLDDYILKWQQGQISARGAAKVLGIDHKTFLNWAREK